VEDVISGGGRWLCCGRRGGDQGGEEDAHTPLYTVAAPV
jgi:hypothetical protein